MSNKRYLGVSVYQAAQDRISWAFDTFPRVYCSLSGGKDSTVMTHMVMNEAIKRKREVGILCVDLEGQYKLTIKHVQEMYDLYAEHIEPHWVALPIALRNAVSMYEPKWTAWEPGREDDWIRQPSPMQIVDQNYYPFYQYDMEFEEFVPDFGHWYAQDKLTACFVGIRTAESLNRWRTIAGHGTKFEGRNWTNYMGQTLWNVYPIYDWKAQDIWTYHGLTNKPYNRIYDLMHRAGVSIHQARLCQPYGDDQRKGLWLFHILEPETWSRIVARVNGANSGALYAKESGNITGNIKVTKPEGHTWESFAMLLLGSMPEQLSEHYKNKIAVFLHWWHVNRGYITIPDEADRRIEADRKAPSWRRVCKALLRNDYYCKGLSFSPTKSSNYRNYERLMKRRRSEWGIFAPGEDYVPRR